MIYHINSYYISEYSEKSTPPTPVLYCITSDFFRWTNAHILILPFFIFALIKFPPLNIAKTFNLGQGHNNPYILCIHNIIIYNFFGQLEQNFIVIRQIYWRKFAKLFLSVESVHKMYILAIMCSNCVLSCICWIDEEWTLSEQWVDTEWQVRRTYNLVTVTLLEFKLHIV